MNTEFSFEEEKHTSEIYHHDVQLFDKNTEKVFYEKLTYNLPWDAEIHQNRSPVNQPFWQMAVCIENPEDLTKRPARLLANIFSKLF